MDEDAREKLLDDFRRMCAEAFYYAYRAIYNDLMRVDTGTHPLFTALQNYLTENDSTDRTLKIARYAAELMMYHFCVTIQESERFDIVGKVEGGNAQSVPELSDLFAQESVIALEEHSEYGSTVSKLYDLQVKLREQS